MVDLVFYVDEMSQTLQNLFKGNEKKPLLYLLHGMNTDSSNYSKPAKFEVTETFVIFFIYYIQL
jgi:Xaa-Pro dipeptidase